MDTFIQEYNKETVKLFQLNDSTDFNNHLKGLYMELEIFHINIKTYLKRSIDLMCNGLFPISFLYFYVSIVLCWLTILQLVR